MLRFDRLMSDQPPPWLAEARSRMNVTPYIKGIGGTIEEIWPVARSRVPYSDILVGDPQTGVVHGGVITALLDQTSGLAVIVKLREMMAIATLDLRIDYMRPATPHMDLIAECECMRVTHDFAFVRGLAHQGNATDPIALCTGVFALIRGAHYPMPEKS